MARIRSVKPEYFTDEDVTRLSHSARLLFISMWTQADDRGRLQDAPKRICAEAFGEHERVNASRLIGELAGGPEPRILRYQTAGKKLIAIRLFRFHQWISHPLDSRLPPPQPVEATHVFQGWTREEYRSITGNAPEFLLEDHRRTTGGSPAFLHPDLGSGSGMDLGSGSGTLAPPAAPRPRDLEFEALAESYDIDWQHGLTIAARGNLNAALQSIKAAEDCTPDEIRRRAAFHRQSELGTPTPYALAKHWAQLAHGPVVKATARRETQASRMLALADQIGKGVDSGANGRSHPVDDEARRALPGNV